MKKVTKMATESEKEAEEVWDRGNNQRRNETPLYFSWCSFLLPSSLPGLFGFLKLRSDGKEVGGGADAADQCSALHFCHSPWGFSSWLGCNCSTGINKGLVWDSLPAAGGEWAAVARRRVRAQAKSHGLIWEQPWEGETVCSCE